MHSRIAVLATLLLLANGCSSSSTSPIVDESLNLVSGLQAVDIVPLHYSEGDTVAIRIAYVSKYAGKGRIAIRGRNGGQDVGTLVSPVTGPIGAQQFEVELPAGAMTTSFSILMTPNHSRAALDIVATCDSVLADGQMVWWDSDVAWALYARALTPNTQWIFPSTYASVTLTRAM